MAAFAEKMVKVMSHWCLPRTWLLLVVMRTGRMVERKTKASRHGAIAGKQMQEKN